jgi:hypothetical protein
MGQSPELMQLFAAMTPKVEECQGQLRVYQVGDVMRSLSTFNTNVEVQQLMAALSSKVRDSNSYLGSAFPSGMNPWEDLAAMREVMTAIGPPPEPPRAPPAAAPPPPPPENDFTSANHFSSPVLAAASAGPRPFVPDNLINNLQ